jgi:hypothetical protein
MNIDDVFSTAYHPWEKEENPQSYQQLPQKYINEAPKRHILGLVGGNEVSLIKGNIVDLESDLRGINIPNTFCPQRQYQAPQPSTAKQAMHHPPRDQAELGQLGRQQQENPLL